MLSFLKTTWNKYRALVWWKQLLLLLPLITLAVICVALFFVRTNDDSRLVEYVEHHKEAVDEQLERNDKREDTLKKKEKEIIAHQKKVADQITQNQDNAAQIIHKIDEAAQKNDLEELEQLRKRINSI